MHSVGLVGLDTVTESLSWAEQASSVMMFTYKKSCVAFSAFKGFFSRLGLLRVSVFLFSFCFVTTLTSTSWRTVGSCAGQEAREPQPRSLQFNRDHKQINNANGLDFSNVALISSNDVLW